MSGQPVGRPFVRPIPDLSFTWLTFPIVRIERSKIFEFNWQGGICIAQKVCDFGDDVICRETGQDGLRQTDHQINQNHNDC